MKDKQIWKNNSKSRVYAVGLWEEADERTHAFLGRTGKPRVESEPTTFLWQGNSDKAKLG